MTSDRAIGLALQLRERGLASDPISMLYSEVKVVLNAEELQVIADGVKQAVERRNEAEMVILELLHVLASPSPHAALVEETLSGDTNIFERARALLGVDMQVAGTFGATNG